MGKSTGEIVEQELAFLGERMHAAQRRNAACFYRLKDDCSHRHEKANACLRTDSKDDPVANSCHFNNCPDLK